MAEPTFERLMDGRLGVKCMKCGTPLFSMISVHGHTQKLCEGNANASKTTTDNPNVSTPNPKDKPESGSIE